MCRQPVHTARGMRDNVTWYSQWKHYTYHWRSWWFQFTSASDRTALVQCHQIVDDIFRWCPFAKIQCVFRRLRWEFYFCRREMKTATKMHQTADDAVYYIVDCKLNMWLINLQFTQSFSCVSIKLCLCRWMTVNYRFIRTDWTVEFWVTYMQIDPKF